MAATTASTVEVRASAKTLRMSARKARVVLAHIRGKRVAEARTILNFTPRAAATDIELVLRSAAAAGAAAAPAGAAALSSMFPTDDPTVTVCPVLALCRSTPAAGDGSGMVTLSVSSSTMSSSRFTYDPSGLSHCETTASVMDSPSGGMTMSVAIGPTV